jgi:hypothetical protein
MEKPERSIFRVEVMQRHAQRIDKAVLPRFVSPGVFRQCWLVLGLLALCGLATGMFMIEALGYTCFGG